jgi:ubiquinone biosynthesis protein COQ9
MSAETHDDTVMQLMEAAKAHVPFDGWTEAAFRAAVADCGIEPGAARAACPRGAVDLALAFHEAGDRAMLERIAASDMAAMRFRDRVAAAVRFRLEAVEDRELVRRGTTLFALPQYAPDGARAIWKTCDRIWTALGDTSEDYNWYTKRATLSGVYGSTVLFWLGDTSEGQRATWDFLDRRIDDVMQIEKVKSAVRKNPLLSPLLKGTEMLLSGVRAPGRGRMSGLPGSIAPKG